MRGPYLLPFLLLAGVDGLEGGQNARARAGGGRVKGGMGGASKADAKAASAAPKVSCSVDARACCKRQCTTSANSMVAHKNHVNMDLLNKLTALKQKVHKMEGMCEKKCVVEHEEGCEAGRYTMMLGANLFCPKCRPGRYNPFWRQKSCWECPLGHYSAKEAAIECTACPIGKYTDVEGDTSCFTCPGGQYGAFKAQNSKLYCTSCPAGKYMPATAKKEREKELTKAGWEMETVFTNETVCQSCPDGKHTSLPGQTRCKVCPYPKYSRKKNTVCAPCMKGLFKLYTASDYERRGQGGHRKKTPVACIACPLSTYFSVDTELRTCPHCPAGYYQKLTFDDTHRATLTSSVAAIERIGDNMLRMLEYGLGNCTACPKGKHSGFGSTMCESCPAEYAVNSQSAATGCVCKIRDCTVGDWKEVEGGCSKTCGGGVIIYHRAVILMNNECQDSSRCPDLAKRMPCNAHSCDGMFTLINSHELTLFIYLRQRRLGEGWQHKGDQGNGTTHGTYNAHDPCRN
jgi:hypothetical protein